MLIFICVIQTYFQDKTELKVIGHMSDPNSTSLDILLDGPVKDILRPGYKNVFSKTLYCLILIICCLSVYWLINYLTFFLAKRKLFDMIGFISVFTSNGYFAD